MNDYHYFQQLVSYYNIADAINIMLNKHPEAEVFSVIGSSNNNGGQGDAIILYRKPITR
jgi:hypothetical protein